MTSIIVVGIIVALVSIWKKMSIQKIKIKIKINKNASLWLTSSVVGKLWESGWKWEMWCKVDTHPAEVLALQQRLGISYKDASHWLYIIELEKLKVAEASHKAFKDLDMQIGEYLKNIDIWFGHIDANANASVSVSTDDPGPAATTWPLYTCATWYLNLRNLHKMDK